MRYGHLAWPDVRDLDKDKIVLLPLGSCEQHGPHMPLLTDTLLVTAFAEAVEKQLADDLLLLPTQWMGMSDHHLNFAGTVTANPELYTRWLVRALETLIKHGFRKIFMLNGHGGNQVPANQALVELYSRGHERRDLWVGFASYWHLGQPTIKRAALQGLDGLRFHSPMLTHADEWEYSLGLHVFPQLCQPEKAKAIPADFKTSYYDVDLSIQVISLSTPFTAFLPTGAANRPELASPEKGKALFAGILKDLLEFFAQFKTWKEHHSNQDMGVF
jgi:creatinine amidohydrolase